MTQRRVETRDRSGRPPDRMRNGGDGSHEDGLAMALGWFSIGLGLAELVAPSSLARAIGVRDDDENRNVLRAMGVRELSSGIGILSQPRPAGWMWSRVGGDAMDLTLLGAAAGQEGANPARVGAAAAAVLGVAALDLVCANRLSGQQASRRQGARRPGAPKGRIEERKAVTVNKPAAELYAFWREFQNFPSFMYHLESVEPSGDGRSHWKAKAPLGLTVSWDAEVTEDRPNERIAWRSAKGASVPNEGSVEFIPAPGGRGTTVHVSLRYDPPGGRVGALFAKLFGREPGQELQEDLRSFKQVMETGEIMRSEGDLRPGHAARPAVHPERYAH